MTPKEKANELWKKMLGDNNHYLNKNIEIDKIIAKKCALVCVDECIKEYCHESKHKEPLAQDRWIDYWQEVKKEISLLQLTIKI